MSSMVLWYDLAKQGATNESMAADPRLIDHSGNGHHATCYNFAWTEDSGISTVNYPHALVSDGVDDYAVVEGLPILTKERGFTLISKRDNIYRINSILFSKGPNNNTDNQVFTIERTTTGNDVWDVRFGKSNKITNLNSNNIIVNTSKTYGDVVLSQGESSDSEEYFLYIQGVPLGRHGKSNLYSLLLFDRDLTTEEIEWVKTNLITE